MATFKVQYKGLSDIREMSVKDLAAAGVTVDKKLRWERRSVLDPVVYVTDPSDELLEVLKAEGTFNVVEVDAKTDLPTGVELIKSTKKDDTGDTVVDGTTGQVTSKAHG